MEVVASTLAIILKFDDLKDLEGVIENLQGQAAWIKQENVKPPYLYSVYDDRIESDEIFELLQRIKNGGE